MTIKAICGQCGAYAPYREEPTIVKGNPWRCVATRKCLKRAYG